MSAHGVTFGQAISKARKGLGLSQKELAARVMKEEGRRVDIPAVPQRHRA